MWVKLWLNRRNELGCYNTLMHELRTEEIEEYKKFLRLTPALFDELLELIETDIQKQAKVKLSTTLKILSSDMNYA